ncbi:MAG: M20 family metallopeptidase [Clostridiales bacterium]|nr:M20 family metallopeptidase [Clostridiales bacterium]
MQNFNEFINDLKTLISYKSVLASPEKNAPFGIECRKALDCFLSIAERFGFETINYDGYGGEIAIGSGEEVGIIGHLDVVPTGIGWNTDPFTLTEKDGTYYGRGIADDKAAPLLCLYALKELKDSGISVNRKIRLIVGCDEESGWRDIAYMKKVSHFPEYGFSPDAGFPLSYAEKSITEVEFCIPALKNFHGIVGGTALNAVCDFASVTTTLENIDLDLIKKHGLSLKDNGVIESVGKAAHGSSPHLGKNAIKPLFELFKDCGEDVDGVIDYLFNDKYGLFNIKTEQGNVTLSPNLIKQVDDKIYIKCDCRIPAPLNEEDLTAAFDSFNIPYTVKSRHPSMMVEKEGWLVSALLSAFNAVTGSDEKPFAMGGSTFARAFKHGCAFGPIMKGKDNKIHDANEFMTKSELLTAYEIYKKAIFNLAEK